MKKSVLSILLSLMLFPVLCTAQDRSAELRTLVGSYRGTSGFEVFQIGKPFIGLMKLVLKTQTSDAEEKALLEALSGVSRLTVVDYEDCPGKVKTEFTRKVNRILKDEDLLLEAKDGSDKVRIYGILSKDGKIVRDVILHEEGDGNLICFSGRIRTDQLGALIAEADRR